MVVKVEKAEDASAIDSIIQTKVGLSLASARIMTIYNGHWILARFEISTGILQIFNSLLTFEMSSAVNGIAECLMAAYNKPVQIEQRQCPQRLNSTDCGFFAMMFLLQDVNGYDRDVQSKQSCEHGTSVFRQFASSSNETISRKINQPTHMHIKLFWNELASSDTIQTFRLQRLQHSNRMCEKDFVRVTEVNMGMFFSIHSF